MEHYSSPPEPIYVMRASADPIHSLIFHLSPNVEYIYAGTESGTINIWNLETNRQVKVLESSTDSCLSLNFDNDCLVSQKKGGALNLWQISDSNWSMIKTIETDYFGFCRCQKSSEKTLFTPLKDSLIGLLSLKTFKTELTLDPFCLKKTENLGNVMAIKPCIDDSNYILAAYDVGKLLLWDVRNKNVLSSMEVEASPMAMDFHNSAMSGIIGGPGKELRIFTLSTEHQLKQKQVIPLINSGISVIKIRDDAKIFVAGSWDNCVRVYSYKSCKALAVLDQHKSTVHDVIYSVKGVRTYDNKLLMAVGSKDGTISFWDIYNKKI